MEFKIISEKNNVLLNRKEIVYEIQEEVIPSKETVKEKLSEKYGFDKELIEVLKISGKFGVKVFEISIHLYDNAEEMEKTVLRSKKQRDEKAKAIEEEKKKKEEEEKAKEEETKNEVVEKESIEEKPTEDKE